MDIFRAESRAARIGPPTSFTGHVVMEPVNAAPEPARAFAIHVTFTPGARTFWHTHPLGQTLFITHGLGRVQSRGGPLREVRAGDTVWFAPGEEHWHGAAPGHIMSHLAIADQVPGNDTNWLDAVTDEDYAGEPTA